MKILFILENYYPNIGGVETLFKSLAEKLKEEGHEILVITQKSQKGVPSFEVINGVQIKRLPFTSRFAFTFFSLPWILYYGRKAHYFHTTSYNAAVPAFFAAKLLGKQCFITFHEYWGKLWFQLPHLNLFSRFLFYWYEKMISAFRFDEFIAVSEFTRQSLVCSGVRPDRIVLIYNGIEYESFSLFRHRPPVNFTVTYFGRIGISKGVDILLEAAKDFLEQHPETRLKLIVPLTPKGPLNRVRWFIAKNNLTQNVILLHHLTYEQLKKELCASSCVVIPSYSEGFCFAAAEVAAMGIPLISSDKAALKEVVSGSCIKMDELSVPCLIRALEKAKAKQWTVLPAKYFTLDECIEWYKQLYSCAG
jgi:glycosyltransferase involved in cell wall biosynthesis